MSDTNQEEIFPEETINSIFHQTLQIWLETHDESLAVLDETASVTRSWLEPFVIALDVHSTVFLDLSIPEKDTIQAEVGSYVIFCGLVADGLRVVIQYVLPDAEDRQASPGVVSSFLPLGDKVDAETATEFLNLLWEDWNETNNTNLPLEILDISGWETQNALGQTSVDWLKSLGPEAVLFNVPLVDETHVRDFMVQAESFMVGSLGVLRLANPFLTRNEQGSVAGNLFVLTVGDLVAHT